MTENQKAQHTPGPWEIFLGDGERLIRTPWISKGLGATHVGGPLMGDYRGGHIAHIGTNGQPDFEAQAEANARLIAAAPELLEACHVAASALYVAYPAPSAEQLAKVYNALCDAISKAEGRS